MDTTHSRGAALSLVAALFLTLLSFVALTASPASAEDGCGAFSCGIGGGGDGTKGDSSGNPGAPTGGGTPTGGGSDGGSCTGFGCASGGGGSSFTWTDSGRGFFPARPPARLGGSGPFTPDSKVIRYNNKCAGFDTWTINGRTYRERYIGWSWRFVAARVPVAGSAANGAAVTYQTKVLNGSYSCIKPPHYRDDLVPCPISGRGVIIGPMLNGDGVPSKTYPQPVKKSAFERGGRTNAALCDTTLRYFVDGSHVLVNYGQYELRIQLTMARCTIRTYTTRDARTGRIPPREVLGCGPNYVAKTAQAKAELICQDPEIHYYWSKGKYNYSLADCDSGGKWSCGPTLTQKPTFNGVRNTGVIGVLDDGKARRASWARPRPTGEFRNRRDLMARLVYRDGSPFRSGESKNGSTQPFVVEPINQRWFAGWTGQSLNSSRTAWDLSFQAPGVSGQPWQARPEWQFTADFRFMVPNLVFDTETGELSHTKTYIWKELTGKCVGQPVRLDVHRARNSTN